LAITVDVVPGVHEALVALSAVRVTYEETRVKVHAAAVHAFGGGSDDNFTVFIDDLSVRSCCVEGQSEGELVHF